MNKNRRHAMVFLGTLSGAALLSGVAAAGNPHGTPPGQAKTHASGRASAHTTIHQSSHASVHAKVHVHAKLHASVHARSRSSVVVTTSSAAGNAVGVKSSSTTGFNTTAVAASSATKSYGNGRTAGQIAEQNGAGASAVLYGPGNSQPHKAALCFNGKMHLIDVHALKLMSTLSCLSASGIAGVSASVTTSGSAGVHGNGHAFGHVNGHANGLGAKAGAKAQAGVHVRGAVKASHSKRNRALVGVAGAVHAQAKPATAVVGTASFTG